MPKRHTVDVWCLSHGGKMNLEKRKKNMIGRNLRETDHHYEDKAQVRDYNQEAAII
jgi:hypothetical protein